MWRAVLAVAFVVLCGCGSTTTAAQPSPTPSPSPLSCTSSGPASADWPAPSTAPATAGILSASANGDVLTLTFRTGTPAFVITAQPNTHFVMDPNGQPVDLTGHAGVLIKLSGFRGDVANLEGQVTATSLGPLVLEVRKVGDFEGVVSFAVGLDSAGCANVTANGSTLTFHFTKAPA